MNSPTTNADISIREYSPEDRSACLALFESNRPKYFTEPELQLFSKWLDRCDRPSFSVMEKAGRIIACGGIYHDTANNTAGLAWGMVRQDLHRRGYGRLLTLFRLDQLRDQFPNLAQHIETSQYTFEFYEKLGFVLERVTPNGFGIGLDRYDMVRHSQP